MTERIDAARPRPAPLLAPDAHKGDAGRVLCLCGSPAYPGAAILVARAAQRAGAGLVTLGCFDADLRAIVASAVPETVYLDLVRSRELVAGRLPERLRGRADHVRVAGPGLGQGGRSRVLVRRLVEDFEFEGALVLDADGLNVLSDELELLRGVRGPLVVTPHPGEAARLLGVDGVAADEAGRVDAALEISRRSGGVCCLKGRGTVVTDGERVAVNPTGNPGMASAGAGDVLAGILGAYLARRALPGEPEWTAFEAAVAAVHVHGLAGDLAAAALGERALIASDLIEHLPGAQARLERSEE